MIRAPRLSMLRHVVTCGRRANHVSTYQFLRYMDITNQFAAGLKPHIDFKHLRENVEKVEANIRNRKSKGDVRRVIALYDRYNELLHRIEELRRQRHQLAKSDMSVAERQEAGRVLKAELSAMEDQLSAYKQQLDAEARQLPCDTHPAAPIGAEDKATALGVYGSLPRFTFTPKDHLTLGTALKLFDTSSAASIAGSGFIIFKNDGVLLEQALLNWALSRAIAAGFSAISPPDLAHSWLVEGCGFNPRDTVDQEGPTPVTQSSQVYSISNSNLCLIGTSEIALAGLHANNIMHRTDLPAKYCAISHCFRRESGANGQRDKGLYRLHQFSKVELFAFVNPDDEIAFPRDVKIPIPGATNSASEALFQHLVDFQASLLQELGLHFRVLDMPTEELGASAFRKVDMEVWMPGRAFSGAFGEVSSASNCVDYQARRLNIRCKTAANENKFVHTLNATACAVPRVMLALLETHQNADGSVSIPPCLQPYMGGKTVLKPSEPLR